MAQLQATLKAEYFPTHQTMCDFITYCHFGVFHQNEKLYKFREKHLNQYSEYMKKKVYPKKKDWFKIPSYSAFYFQKSLFNHIDLLNNFQIDTFELYQSAVNGNISILDPFAGEGLLLNNVKQYLNIQHDATVQTIGVELVKERADKLKENGTNIVFNNAFENVLLPRESISLLYFNPPYDSIGDNRLTKHYLKDIIDRKILCPSKSYMDFIIREDDFLDCIDFIMDYFHIEIIFKAPQEEYNKFKQIIVIARYRGHESYKPDSKYLIQGREDIKNDIVNSLSNLPEIDVTKIDIDKLIELRELHSLNLKDKIKKMKMKNNSKKMVSINDNVWSWFRENTEIKTHTIDNITIPKPLKQGEMINIISSGMINGLVGEGTERNHVVVGGIEQIEETKMTTVYDKNGNGMQQLQAERINKPYLNILLPNGKIIKLLNSDNIYKKEGDK